MKKGKWEYFEGRDKQFYFHLKAKNGKVILQSEGYKHRGACLKAIKSIRTNADSPIIFHEEPLITFMEKNKPANDSIVTEL
jgi:uncharacterized protein YegP (UPF0339 family)